MLFFSVYSSLFVSLIDIILDRFALYSFAGGIMQHFPTVDQ